MILVHSTILYTQTKKNLYYIVAWTLKIRVFDGLTFTKTTGNIAKSDCIWYWIIKYQKQKINLYLTSDILQNICFLTWNCSYYVLQENFWHMSCIGLFNFDNDFKHIFHNWLFWYEYKHKFIILIIFCILKSILIQISKPTVTKFEFKWLKQT